MVLSMYLDLSAAVPSAEDAVYFVSWKEDRDTKEAWN